MVSKISVKRDVIGLKYEAKQLDGGLPGALGRLAYALLGPRLGAPVRHAFGLVVAHLRGPRLTTMRALGLLGVAIASISFIPPKSKKSWNGIRWLMLVLFFLAILLGSFMGLGEDALKWFAGINVFYAVNLLIKRWVLCAEGSWRAVLIGEVHAAASTN